MYLFPATWPRGLQPINTSNLCSWISSVVCPSLSSQIYRPPYSDDKVDYPSNRVAGLNSTVAPPWKKIVSLPKKISYTSKLGSRQWEMNTIWDRMELPEVVVFEVCGNICNATYGKWFLSSDSTKPPPPSCTHVHWANVVSSVGSGLKHMYESARKM